MSTITFADLVFPQDLKYTESHEWVRREGEDVVIGVSDYAQAAMRNMISDETLEGMFVSEKLAVGDHVDANEDIGVIESCKAAEDILAPVSGTITAINTDDSLNELVLKSPYDAWLVRIRPDSMEDVDALLSADAFKARCAEEYAEKFGG